YTVRFIKEPIESVKDEIFRDSYLKKLFAQEKDIQDKSIAEILHKTYYAKSKTIVLIFDQFEEFFIYHNKTVRDNFIKEITKVFEIKTDIRIIFCIREEYFAKLSEYEELLPTLYSNRMWVRRMSIRQARQAIVEPCKICGVRVDGALVDELVNKLSESGKGIDLPGMQIVLDALYKKAIEVNKDGPSMTVGLYKDMGGIDSIMSDFIKRVFEKYETPEYVRQILKAMVTHEGTKKLTTYEDIQANTIDFLGNPIPDDKYQSLMLNLKNDMIIREDPDSHMYELRHDSLAAIVYRLLMTANEKELIKVKKQLKERFDSYQSNRILLDEEFLEYIVPHEKFLNVDAKTLQFINASKKALLRKHFRYKIIGVLVIIVISILAGIANMQRIRVEIKELELRRNLSNYYVNLANGQRDSGDIGSSLINYNNALKNFDNMAARINSAYAQQSFIPEVAVLLIHKGNVNSVSFSPKGKLLASASDDKTILLWDIDKGQALASLNGHTDTVISVNFSPDGRLLASASNDTTICLWDVETYKELASLEGHTDTVRAVNFSPDGGILASAAADNTVRLWDVDTRQELAVLSGHLAAVTSVSFKPDGKILASASADETIKLWDVKTHEELGVLKGHSATVRAVSFSPDGRRLASASDDYTVRLWDINTRKEVGNLKGHMDIVRAINFSPDGKFLVSTSYDETIRLWDVKTRQPLVVLKGHSKVLSINFSPDGRLLASASADDTIRLWAVRYFEKNQGFGSLKGHSNRIASIDFSPDGRRLASASTDKTIKVWDMETRQELGSINGHVGSINFVTFAPDSRLLASASNDTTIMLWDAKTLKEIASINGHTYGVNSLDFSSDGKLLVSGSTDKTVIIWDVYEHQVLASLNGHNGKVNSVNFSTDGKFIVSGSTDKTAIIWDVSKRQVLTSLNGHMNDINSVNFSPDGRLLASASADETIKLWDVETHEELGVLKGHSASVRAIDFSPDGKLLASGSTDKTVKLWDVETHKELASLGGHMDTVTSVHFSPDGKLLASASADKTIQLLDMNIGAINDIIRRLDTYISIGLSYELDINNKPDPKDYVDLTKQRLEYAQKGLIRWLPDGGRGWVVFYKNNLAMIEKFIEETSDKHNGK
ncbi:MAG: WD40 repeat domain-containing protein, partial [Candidatus Magnetoovum sp. WYHC-5]|nr:WD40 repeat domain-containing protein [Candidatus Magnetoovum sp. WYHC-5]